MDGIDDAVVGREGESGDVFVDGLEGLVEILGASERNEKAEDDGAEERGTVSKRKKIFWRAEAGHGFG
jgi:hypothetical protein